MPSNFQPTIPTGTVPLDQDYQNVQKNFQQLDTTFGIDHTLFSDQTNFNGMHKVVHMIETAVIPPAAVVGTGELYTSSVNDGINTDSTLYYQTSAGRVMQLTRNFVPVTNVNGYTYLPGGLILQWGRVNGSHTGGKFNNGDTASVTFTQAFPNNCFALWFGPSFKTSDVPSSSSGATVTYDQDTLSNTAFTWLFLTGSGAFTRFTWWALGR